MFSPLLNHVCHGVHTEPSLQHLTGESLADGAYIQTEAPSNPTVFMSPIHQPVNSPFQLFNLCTPDRAHTCPNGAAEGMDPR